MLLAPQGRRSAALPSTAAPFCRPPATASASSPAATTARWWRPMRAARPPSSPPTPSAAGSITSRSGPDGAVAWSAGKTAHSCAPAKASERALEVPSTVGGLAFAPKGFRLAIAHYNGVTLWFPERRGRAREARMEGLASRRRPSARTAASWSPPCRSRRCTAGGWPTARTCACRAIRRACARSTGRADGEWLATSGSTQLILWPFDGKDGPMGKTPQLLAPTEAARVETVACHPQAGRWWRSAMPTVSCCWCGSTTARRSWRKQAGDAPVTRARLERRWQAAGLRHRRRRSRRGRSRLRSTCGAIAPATEQLRLPISSLAPGTHARVSAFQSRMFTCHRLEHNVLTRTKMTLNQLRARPPCWRGDCSSALAVAGIPRCRSSRSHLRTLYAQISVEFRTALEHYGDWQRDPRYGDVWVPADCARDWRPYDNGHWVYTDDWGWYWVSEATPKQDWGWVTYHYGRWVYDNDGLVLGARARNGGRPGSSGGTAKQRCRRLGAAAAGRGGSSSIDETARNTGSSCRSRDFVAPRIALSDRAAERECPVFFRRPRSSTARVVVRDRAPHLLSIPASRQPSLRPRLAGRSGPMTFAARAGSAPPGFGVQRGARADLRRQGSRAAS